jgi:SSS family solute:Na+ symporter
MWPILVDSLIVVIYFIVIAWIGLRMSRKRESLAEFALGGRAIPWWAVLASIIAAETTAATFLGVPAEGYRTRSILYAQVTLGTILARVIVAYLFIKPYYQYNVYSVYELLEKRFGSRTRFAGSLVFLITRILASGVRLYIGSVVLVIAYKFLTGITPTFKYYLIAIVLMATVTTIYTAFGGIKAVIWTDVIQACMMFGGAIFALLAILYLIPGGWSGVTAATDGFKDFKVVDWGLSGVQSIADGLRAIFGREYTLWTGVIGYTFLVMATHGTDQDMVQRMLTAPDIRRSRRSLILSGVADLPIALVFVSVGILLFAFYKITADAGLPKADNEIFAYFIVTRLPVGIRGLIIAAIFATAMGSFSAALNALATSFVRDFYSRYIKPKGNDDDFVKAARVSTAAFSLLMVLVAAVAAYQVLGNPNTTIIPVALTIFGYTYGPLLGIFLVGLLTKSRGNDRTNIFAMLAGFLGIMILSGKINSIIGTINETFSLKVPIFNVPDIAFTWYVMLGCLITFAVAILARTDKQAEPVRQN